MMVLFTVFYLLSYVFFAEKESGEKFWLHLFIDFKDFFATDLIKIPAEA